MHFGKKLQYLLLVAITLFCGNASAADEFETVRCGSDIPKAMIGKHSPTTRKLVPEVEYKSLALRNLGTDMIDDNIYYTIWSICGAEYYELVGSHHVVADVLPIPVHSRTTPAMNYTRCFLNGHEMDENIFAILNNRSGENKKYDATDMTKIPAIEAWRVDKKKMRFIKIDASGIYCLRSAASSAF